ETVVPGKPEWELIWADEFDYEGLPDAAKWDYEVGFVRNNEEQYYTKARRENAYVADGVLTITGRKESYPNADYSEGSSSWKTKDEFAQYTSACLITRGKASWTYGRIEVSAKLPAGHGVWPAIWMLGFGPWPDAGEIDIMEHVGFESDKIHSNVHYVNINSREYATQMRSKTISDVSNIFHTYALEWTEEELIWYIDDIEMNRFRTSQAGNAFHNSQYLLINLALGGDWGGWIDPDIFPQEYSIDYVRVY